MIEAHVQYNGGWKVYRELQPNLKCEFEDHSTCKQASERFQAEEDAKAQEIKDAEALIRKAEVEASAVTAEADAKKAETDAAGQKKYEAIRVLNRNAAEALKEIDDVAADKIGTLKAKTQAKAEEIEKKRVVDSQGIIADQKAKIEELNAKDWLSEVRASKEDA